MNASFFTDLDPDIYKTFVLILLLILAMWFVLTILKKLLDHKLKTKILEKGISKEMSALLLQIGKSDNTKNSIKWFLVLLSTGIGLFLTEMVLPLGIHSFAIMAISISIGFLVYSIYLKSLNK